MKPSITHPILLAYPTLLDTFHVKTDGQMLVLTVERLFDKDTDTMSLVAVAGTVLLSDNQALARAFENGFAQSFFRPYQVELTMSLDRWLVDREYISADGRIRVCDLNEEYNADAFTVQN